MKIEKIKTNKIKTERILKIKVKNFGIHIFTPIIEKIKKTFSGKITRKPKEADVVSLEIEYKGKRQTMNLMKGDTIEFDREIGIEIK